MVVNVGIEITHKPYSSPTAWTIIIMVFVVYKLPICITKSWPSISATRIVESTTITRG